MTSTSGARAKLLGTLASVLTALAVVVGSVGLAAPAQAATTHVTLAGHSTAWSDQKTTLTATWKLGSKAHKGKVTLQRKSGKTWKKVATKTTTSKGVAKFSVKPASTTTYRLLTSGKKASKAKKLTVKKAYTLTTTAGSTIMAGTGKTFSLTYHHHGKAASGTALVERHSGSTWVKVTSVKISKGHGKVTLKPTATTTYRFRVSGKVTSASHKVTVKAPSTFSITGSGSGHGVGLSQYGAYEMALEGKSAAQILQYYYPKTEVGTTTNPARRIQVQVFGHGSDTASTTTVRISAGNFQILGDAEDLDPTTVASTTPVTLTVANGKVTARAGAASVTASTIRIQWSGTTFLPSSVPAYATVAGAQGTYRNGELIVTAIDGQPNVVNDVLLNTEYLYGIDEMLSVWGTATRTTDGATHSGLAALEAQAIASRNYALLPALKAPMASCNCHVYDDTRSQNYTGWKKQNGSGGATWVKAVNATTTATTDDVVTYTDPDTHVTSYAETVYSAAPGYPTSSTGGTANNKDAFGTPAIPYLQHVTDPYTKEYPHLPASVAHWTDSISQATAKKVFGLSSVRSIAVTSRYSSGQVETLTATADNGTTKKALTKTSEQWRTTLGLPAAWVTSFTPRK
ncbi:SpoIID/LytB domain-containing protein [Luteimicrobium album]|uniref:SpoIID/LytB domain-containing protein n=1 Tax=Luteimicrobium album TaxID=1054550 RepID=UPI0024E1189A|nr:SpoIID/LytB domain-containing protein [Luteimicrobium album]